MEFYFCYGLSGLFAVIGYFLTPGSTLWFITFAISQVLHCAGIGHAYGIVGEPFTPWGWPSAIPDSKSKKEELQA